MATRESLNKLKKNSLQRLAEELGVVFEKKTKEEIINSILNLNVPIHFEGSPLDTPHFTEVQYVSLDAEAIPDLPFSAIVRFMVDRQVQGRAVQNFRGLDRAAKHFEAGDVKEILMAKVNDSTIYFKAFCLASMKKIKYQIFISARCLEGEMTINHAYCQCPIGLAQSCSHIGSLLFALNSIKKEAENSCTSKLCKWNVPRQLNLPAAPLSEMNLRKAGSIASGGDQPIKKTIQFDPRHPDHRDTDLSALQALRDVFPNTGMACIWDIPERTPTPVSEVTVTSYVNPLETDLQKLVDLSESLHANILQPISEELSSFVEMRTRSQRNSPEWISLHKGRLTSSIFGDIIRAGEHPRSLISGILHGSSLQRLFSVSQEGAVSLTGSENDYVRDEYVVVISVKDNGSPQLESVAVVTVAFPARVVKDTRALDMASSNDLVAIILGIVAAILLFVIIFLIIYIIRRRQFVEEQLDRAKIRQGMDPRGLTYQRGDPSPDPSSKIDINFDGDLEEASDIDSHTTIQQNPLNFRLPAARQNGEIQIETAVIPYDDNFEYQNHMRTFHVEEISSNSDTSDSTGDSHKVLMEKHKRSPRVNANSLSWAGSNPPSSTFGSDIIVPEEQVTKEKPEITVYF